MALMYNDRSRRVSEDGGIFSHALRSSPLLTAASGAALIAGGCRTFGGALILTVFMAVLLPVIGLVSAIERERIRPERRAAVYFAGAALGVFLLSIIMDNIVLGCVEALGIYAPLAAASPLMLARTDDDAPILTRREAVFEGLGCAASFALIALPVGFIRELLGLGSIFGKWLGGFGNDVFSRPFVGFILCGFAAALIRRLTAQPERASGTEVRQ